MLARHTQETSHLTRCHLIPLSDTFSLFSKYPEDGAWWYIAWELLLGNIRQFICNKVPGSAEPAHARVCVVRFSNISDFPQKLCGIIRREQNKERCLM